MTDKLNRCYFQAVATGTADLEVASPESGFLDPDDAGAVDGEVYAYIAENGTPPTQWEIGSGAWDAGASTLARTTVIASSNSGSAVTFSAAPKVRMGVPLAADFNTWELVETITVSSPVAEIELPIDTTTYCAWEIVSDGLRFDPTPVGALETGDYLIDTLVLRDASDADLGTVDELGFFAKAVEQDGSIREEERIFSARLTVRVSGGLTFGGIAILAGGALIYVDGSPDDADHLPHENAALQVLVAPGIAAKLVITGVFMDSSEENYGTPPNYSSGSVRLYGLRRA